MGFDVGVGELGVQGFQRHLKEKFTSAVEGEPMNNILGPHYVSQGL